VNDLRLLPWTFAYLAFCFLELKDRKQAEQYLDRLEQLSKDAGLRQIDRVYRYASNWYFKTSNDISDWRKAVDLIQEFLNEEDLPSSWRLELLYDLLEIRVKELKINPTVELFKEVQKRLHHLVLV